MNRFKALFNKVNFLLLSFQSDWRIPCFSTGMIELRLCLRTSAQRVRSLLAALQASARLARLAHGCVEAQLFTESQNRRNLCYTETWESEEHLCAMLRSEHFTHLAALMETASEPPALSFRRITAIHGLEFVRQARQSQNQLQPDPGTAYLLPDDATELQSSGEH